MSFRLTKRAELDLEEIDEYVTAEFGEAVADRAIERLFETFGRLAESPGIGRSRPEWADEHILFFPVTGTPSLVIYRRGVVLEILRVWNGRQSPARIGWETKSD